MNRIAILYATISGSTEKYAKLIAQELNVQDSAVINIMNAETEVVESYDTIVVCSPTYGKGDMHYLWKTWIEQDSLVAKHIALVVLGNSRSHTKTFAGALEQLVEEINWKDNTLINVAGAKGLVVDMAARRSQNIMTIKSWSKALKPLIKAQRMSKLESIV